MEIGVPLSQYDLALTQLGFSTICLDVIETDLNVALSEEDQEAWIHTWRFIGLSPLKTSGVGSVSVG